MPVLAVLADGCRALSRRRLWPFIRLRADQERIRDRSIRDGGEASARLARPPPCRQRISRRQGLYDRGHRGVALVWQPREGLAVWCGRISCGRGVQESATLDRQHRQTPGCETRAHGQL